MTPNINPLITPVKNLIKDIEHKIAYKKLEISYLEEYLMIAQSLPKNAKLINKNYLPTSGLEKWVIETKYHKGRKIYFDKTYNQCYTFFHNKKSKYKVYFDFDLFRIFNEGYGPSTIEVYNYHQAFKDALNYPELESNIEKTLDRQVVNKIIKSETNKLSTSSYRYKKLMEKINLMRNFK